MLRCCFSFSRSPRRQERPTGDLQRCAGADGLEVEVAEVRHRGAASDFNILKNVFFFFFEVEGKSRGKSRVLSGLSEEAAGVDV